MDLMPTLSAAWKARVKFLRCKRNGVTGVDKQGQEKGDPDYTSCWGKTMPTSAWY